MIAGPTAMSTPPQTPTAHHRRQRSSIGSLSGAQLSYSRRSSMAGGAPASTPGGGAYSPITPRSSHGRTSTRNSLIGLGAGGPEETAGNGMGNLADELAEAWDSDAEEGDGELVLQNGMEGSDALGLDRDVLDDGEAMRLRRTAGDQYDGSDYGDEEDLMTADGISRGLEAKMAAVESLARRGMERNGSEADHAVERTTAALRDLGGQSSIEAGATRLSTAHSALGTNLAHQTRAITSLTSSLLSPFSIGLDPDVLDDLVALISATLAEMPQANPAALYALHSLSNSTRELVSTLDYLADSLHMSRQTTTTAQRRLRTVKEAMAEWRRENEAKDEGVRWIEKGGWDARLNGRECGAVCREVVGGFEEVCAGWRERLFAGREAEIGAVA